MPTAKRKEMKIMRICEMETHKFIIRLLDEDDNSFSQAIGYTVQAPCYEMAVAQALAYGQSLLRENDDERSLYMRIVGG